MKKTLLMHLALALCLAGVASAKGPTIGVYMDATGTSCVGTTTGGVLQGSIWIDLGDTGDPTELGISGAEFRVDYRHRDDLTVLWTVDAGAAVSVGNPFDRDGVNVAFAACQTATRIPLGTFIVNEINPVVDSWFWLRKRDAIEPHPLDCPKLVLCDGPVFTQVCVSAPDSDHFHAVMNPGVGTSADCQPVAVTASTWSQVKGIFRN